MYNYKKVVIKVGTNVLAKDNGRPDMTTISQIVDEIAALKQQGINVVLVSSGAVGAGRVILPNVKDLSKVVQRQLLASVGQVLLMNIYQNFLSNHGLNSAQVLATKEDFRDRTHYLNMKQCFQALERSDIVPIVNENDVIAIDELMFTDNDELAGLIAAMIGADALFILTNVDGIFNGPPDIVGSKLIAEIDADDESIHNFISPSRSSFGRGGMHTKLNIAQKAAQVGIATHIINGKRTGIISKVINGEEEGTRIVPSQNISNVKKWMAFNEEKQKGAVTINAGAVAVLAAKNKVCSLLPIGIVEVIGEFEKGDLIQIRSEDDLQIGMGIAQYNAAIAREYMGLQDKKPLVHYDYLLIGNY
ncbi:MAG: glutamate 5-kinase [Bacteroidota bacterium]